MMLYDVKEWATMFRVSNLYLRALRRKKHEKTHQQTDRNLGAYRLDKKVLEASRFTPYYHY
jgi:hypothetical protein